MHPETDQYRANITWSEEDACYIGRCPELFGGGIHGDSTEEVEARLKEIISETLNDYDAQGIDLPKPQLKAPRLARALRARQVTGMDQKNFAAAIGVSTVTIRKLEKEGRSPSGAMHTLLGLIEENPSLIRNARIVASRRHNRVAQT